MSQGQAGQSRAALSPAQRSHRLYSPASPGLPLHLRPQLYARIYVRRAPASDRRLYLTLPQICTCSDNMGRFQNRGMMADIYQTARAPI